MSNLTDARTLIAAAHSNACDLWGKTVALYAATTLVVSGLKCLTRPANKSEAAILASKGISCDLVIEVPKQTGFTTAVKPKVNNLVFNTVRYEITSVGLGTMLTDADGESPDAPVAVFTCVRVGSGGIGEGAGLSGNGA